MYKTPIDVVYRQATTDQFPLVSAELIASLPCEEATAGQPYLHQSGGWIMLICCGTRSLSQPDDSSFLVGDRPDYDNDPEGVIVYEGADFADAWAALTV